MDHRNEGILDLATPLNTNYVKRKYIVLAP